MVLNKIFGPSLMQYQVGTSSAPPGPGQQLSTDFRAASYHEANASFRTWIQQGVRVPDSAAAGWLS